MTVSMPLRIAYDASLVPKGGFEVFSSTATPIKSEKKEPAGHLFHKAALIAAGVYIDSDDEEDMPPTPKGITAEFDPARWEGMGEKKRQKKKGSKKDAELDKYSLLGLDKERYLATEKQIKDAYREACLLFHPDKCSAGVEDEEEKLKIEERFKSIQEAYDTLSEPQKRRAYDSTDDFNEFLPMSADDDEHFFKQFGPAFKRQSRWSEKTPVPQLGDADAKDADVEKFYDFWIRFKSWREFPDEEEHDVESAECREHKRWMDRENKALREKNRKKEIKKFLAFVETAYKIDPRIIAIKAAEKAVKEAKKEAKHEAKNKERWEKEAAEQAEKDKIVAEEEAKKSAKDDDKKTREREKKLVRKERARLRSTMTELKERVGAAKAATLPSEFAIDEIAGAMNDLDPLKELVDRLAAVNISCEDAASTLRDVAEKNDINLGNEAPEKEEKAVSAASPAASAKSNGKSNKGGKKEEVKEEDFSNWNEDEEKMLQKALRKFPKGTGRRWETIAQYLRTKSAEEVVKYVKAKGEVFKPAQKQPAEAKTGAAADSQEGEDNMVVDDDDGKEDIWTPAQEQALIKAVKAFPKGSVSSEKDRWARIAEAIPSKNASQAVKHMPIMLARIRANKAAK